MFCLEHMRMSVGELSSSWFPVSCTRTEVHFLFDGIHAEWTEPYLYKPEREQSGRASLSSCEGPPRSALKNATHHGKEREMRDVRLEPGVWLTPSKELPIRDPRFGLCPASQTLSFGVGSVRTSCQCTKRKCLIFFSFSHERVCSRTNASQHMWHVSGFL